MYTHIYKEVVLGQSWDESADLWGLGCLLFTLYTGKRAFQAICANDDDDDDDDDKRHHKHTHDHTDSKLICSIIYCYII